MTLGVKPRERPVPMPWATELGQLDHLDGARPVGQPADEAALLQRRDQPVDAGLGAQVERILHLVEGGRNAGFLEPLMDKAQAARLACASASALPLLARKFPAHGTASRPKQIMNGHYPFHMCSATI